MQKNSKTQNVLKFKNPSNSLAPWESALPLGNGKVGALMQGGLRNDRIMFTDARAIYKGEVGVLPDVSDKLKEARSFMATKNPVMAGTVLNRAFVNKKYTPSPFVSLPIADLVITQMIPSNATNYVKSLGLETAEASVQFSASQTAYERNAFVDYSSDLVYLEFSKNGSAPISVSLSVEAHDKKTMVFNGAFADAPNGEVVTLSASLIGYEAERNGMVYGAMSRVMVDAKAVIDITDSKLIITNAEKVLVVTRVYVGKQKEKLIDKVKQELLNLRQVSYEKSIKNHIAVFQKGASKAEIRMNREKDGEIEELINQNAGTLLYEKLFNYSKYLLRTGVSNNFGVNFVTGLWGSHYQNDKAVLTTSVGLPALYSSAFLFGEEEKIYEMMGYFTKFQDDLKKNAFRIYKSKGFMVPEKFVYESGLPASINPSDLSTITGGAVVANLFYDYFLYTKDTKFLKSEALPFMTSIADFYLNYFQKNNGELNSVPSFAPGGKSKYFENRNIGVYQNSTADFVVARALINNIMNVQNIYSVNVEKIVDYQNFLNALPSLPLEKNAIREYRGEENSVYSTGILHLYNAYATKEVNHFGNPMTLAPYLNSLIFKVDKALFSQSLIALGELLRCSATLGQSGAVGEILKYMTQNYLGDNMMFLNYDKFGGQGTSEGDNFSNIAGNMLVSTALVESVVLSFGNNISIMPAKIADWKEGGVANIPTRQNVLVDIDFDDKRGSMTINLKATKVTKFNLILPRGVKKVKNYTIDTANPRIENITLSAGKTISFDVKY